jgi:hypothetical protein
MSCFCCLCVAANMCFNEPVTNEVPYFLSRECYLRNMFFETRRSIIYYFWETDCICVCNTTEHIPGLAVQCRHFSHRIPGQEICRCDHTWPHRLPHINPLGLHGQMDFTVLSNFGFCNRREEYRYEAVNTPRPVHRRGVTYTATESGHSLRRYKFRMKNTCKRVIHVYSVYHFVNEEQPQNLGPVLILRFFQWGTNVRSYLY